MYSQFYATPSTTDTGTANAPAAVITPTKVSTFESDIFDDPQLYQLERDEFPGYADQHEGVVLDDASPLAPVNIAIANPSIGAVLTLSWETPAQVNYTEAHVYRSTTQGTLGELVTILPVSAAHQLMTYQDTDVENGSRYYYLVRLANGDNESTNATQVVAIPTDSLAPNAPENITVASLGENLQVSWTFTDASDVAAVRIYRSTTRGLVGTQLNEVALADVTVEDDGEYVYVDSTVQPNVPYYYTVTAVDASGNESSKNLLTVPANTNPFAPIEF